MKIADFVLRHERTVFLTVCLATLLPLFMGQYFVTLDGPSHLYNAKIWSGLVFDSKSFLHRFYAINALMPNALSHLILALLLTILPAFIAEKLLIAAYVFLFAYSFRYLLKSFGKSDLLFAYFIFPFIFSYPFLLGFYNFSFGIILLFFTLGYWLSNRRRPFSWKFLIGLTVLVFLTYISHLVLFGLLLILLAIESALAFFQKEKEPRSKKVFSSFFAIAVASILPLFFALRYFGERPVSASLFESLSRTTLVRYLFEIRPIIAFNYLREFPFTLLISLVLLILLLINFINRFRAKNYSPIDTGGKQVNNKRFAKIALLTLIALYFVMPDSDGRGSYISMRLGLLIFPFLILFLSQQKFSRKVVFISIPIVLLAHFILIGQYALVNKQVNPAIKEISSLSENIDANAVVAVVKETDIWYKSHYHNYVALEKPIVLLKNYEAAYGYFPVIWNNASLPKVTVAGYGPKEIPCLKFKSNSKGDAKAADYLLVIGDSKNLTGKCQELFDLISSDKVQNLHYSTHCSLYKL